MENRLDPVLRALPCALRGTSAGLLTFNGLGQLTLPETLEPSISTALMPLVEPCVLYRALDTTLRRATPRGLLRQALFSGIRESLRTYLSLISELELRVATNSQKLTISSLQIMLQSPTLYLRLFLSIVRQCMDPQANVLGVLFEYMQHGDPLVQSYAQELYDTCYEPFKRLKTEWENFGSLSLDVYHEFFIQGPGDASSAEAAATEEDLEFKLIEERIPRSVTEAESQHCLDRGKAIHFIRFVCGDMAFDGVGQSFEEIMEHTNQLLFGEHELMLHFRGLKDYMLLANGNFVDTLFRNDNMSFLMQPVSEVGSYMASEYFVAAIDDLSTSKLENDNVMKCVDAYILGIDSPTTKKQWRVWEAFIGKYHLDARPLRLLVDQAAVSCYERCFASLWRIRLAIYSLTDSSNRLRWLARQRDDVAKLIDAHMIMNAGMLQIQQLLYYRVIDQAWTEFETKLTNERQKLTLTQIKQAHDNYINQIAEMAASPARARNIQGLAKVVLGLQRLLEDAETTTESFEDDLAQLVAKFNELTKSLNYE